MTSNIQDLEEPLLSPRTKKELDEGILKSYLEQFKKPEPKEEGNKEEEQAIPAEEHKDEPKEEYVPGNLTFEEQRSWYKAKERNANFYSQASINHKLPSNNVLFTAVNGKNPEIFAALIQADPYMREIELEEPIALEDYKNLTKIRVCIYISLLRMIAAIDRSDKNHREVKTKLLQVKALTKNLSMSEYDRLYEALNKDIKIFDIDEEQEDEEKRIKEELEAKAAKLAEKQNQNEEGKEEQVKDEESHSDEEEETEEAEEQVELGKLEQYYQEYFQKMNCGYGSQSYELDHEEEKWEVRTEWLEQKLQEISSSSACSTWATWLEAKFIELEQLDVPFKNNRISKADEVFYLHEHIFEKTQPFDCKQMYPKDQNTQIPHNYDYPTIEYNNQDNKNQSCPIIRYWATLKNKLCLRRQRIERETDFIIAVFERKPLGNIKLYEKRLNARHYDENEIQMKFHPDEPYLFLSFMMRNPKTYSYPQVQLVFPYEAKYKAPLILQPNGHFICFQEGNCFQLVKEVFTTYKKKSDQNQEKPEEQQDQNSQHNDEEEKKEGQEQPNTEEDQQSQKKEEQEEEELEKIEEIKYFVFIYDLYAYSKVQKIQLGDHFKAIFDNEPYYISDRIRDQIFGKIKEGFYYLNYSTQEILICTQTPNINNIKITIPQSKGQSNHNCINSMKINFKGDRLIVHHSQSTKCEFEEFSIYSIDINNENIKLEESFKITDNEGIQSVYCTSLQGNDFLICLNYTLKDNCVPIHYYINKVQLTNALIENKDEYKLELTLNEKGEIQKMLYFVDRSYYLKQQAIRNKIVYQRISQIQQNNEKPNWVKEIITHEILNTQVLVSCPYAYFFYNHDQIFMKDLTKYGPNGFKYMNNFMGINKDLSPICLFGYIYNSKQNFQIITINKSYQQGDVQLRVHQAKTHIYQSKSEKFEGKIRFRIYGFNHLLNNEFEQWISKIYSGKEIPQISMTVKGNALYLEKQNKQDCIKQRLIITNYQSPIDYNNVNPTKSSAYEIKQKHIWCIIKQDDNNIKMYTNLMRYSFRDIRNAEEIWDYTEDDSNNQIYTILVDTFEKNRVSIYIVYNNAQMRKFQSCVIPTTDGWSTTANMIYFEEAPQLYAIDSLFSQQQNQGGTASKGAVSKKINLTKQLEGQACILIANGLLYSQLGLLELSVKSSSDKNIFCFKIDSQIENVFETDKQVQFHLSSNEGKFGLTYRFNYGQQHQILFLTPLLNSRSVPLFQSNRFHHPIKPFINMEKGYTSAFTLNLQNKFTDSSSFIKAYNFWDKLSYKKMRFSNPGILIKYFNGVEEEIPMHKKGIVFGEIIRFSQSSDGKFAFIMGRKLDLTLKPKTTFECEDFIGIPGIYVFSISENSFEELYNIPFANKIQSPDTRIVQKHRLFVERELKERPFGNEYSYSSADDGYCYCMRYDTPNIDVVAVIQKQIQDKNRYNPSQVVSQLIKDRPLNESQKEQLYAKLGEKILNYEISLPSDPAGIVVWHQGNFGLQFKRFEDSEKAQEFYNGEGMSDYAKVYIKDGSRYNQNGAEPWLHMCLGYAYELCKRTFLKDIEMPFNNFNIPYIKHYDDKSSCNQRLNEICIGEVNNPKFIADEHPEVEKTTIEYEEELAYENGFTDVENNLIEQMHKDMITSINKEGHIFIVEMHSNTLFFFMKNKKTYSLRKLYFDPDDFQITKASSEGNLLFVTSKFHFRVFQIDHLFESGEQLFQPPIIDSKEEEKLINKSLVGLDEETYTLLDCAIFKHYLILKYKDLREIESVRVYDIKKRMITSFYEGDRFYFSNCNNFLWIPKQEVVYDIINDLSTLFLWSGKRINVCIHEDLDSFSINEDRTMMITQGFIHLAFDFLSILIDEDLFNFNIKGEESKKRIINQIGIFENIFYKIHDYKSALEKTFELDYDKQSYEKFKDLSQEAIEEEKKKNETLKSDPKKYKEKQIENDDKNCKNLSSLLLLIANSFDVEKGDYDKLTKYFLSYYYVNQNENGEKELFNIFQRLFKTETKRLDLIEDILHYFLKSIEKVPIIQQAILKNFMIFLENADTNLPFQEYLRSITQQSKFMADVEKFQITMSDAGFEVRDHDSPFIDNKFYTNVKNIKESKKEVNIYYIYLGNLLKEKGKEMMGMLGDSQYLGIMDIPVIQYLVVFQWSKVKAGIMNKLFYPFLALLIFFTIYTMNIVHYNIQEQAEANNLENTVDVVQELIDWAFRLIIAFILIYFLGMEVSQLLAQPGEYFESPWNFADIFSYSLCTTVVILDMLPTNGDGTSSLFPARRAFATIASIVLWIKLFYFLRLFDTTAKLIRMIMEILNDMKNFLIVLFICIIGFTNGFYILQQGIVDLEKRFAGANSLTAFIYTYRLTLGDFQLDNFGDLSTPLEVFLAWGIFVFGSLFVVIVILNLLIAIMGDTFSRVLENITNLNTREKVMMISENEAIFKRDDIFKDSHYLFIIAEKNNEASQGENWDGQMNALKKQMLCKFQGLEDKIHQLIEGSNKEIKKKLSESEEKARKSASTLDQKMHVLALIQDKRMEEIINDNSTKINGLNNQLSLTQDLITTQIKMVSEEQQKLLFVQKKLLKQADGTQSESEEE